MIHLTSLPVPETHIATGITASHELPIGRKGQVHRIPSVIVATEALLAILPELVRRAVNDDLVIA